LRQVFVNFFIPPRKIFFLLLFAVSFPGFSQTALERGMRLYGQGDYYNAVNEFLTVAPEDGDYGEALYWMILSELAAENYNDAKANLETLEKFDPNNRHSSELPYHKARILYYLGNYNEALIIFSNYSESQIDKTRKAAALYWAGECLLALGQLDRAENLFALVMKEYPLSAKYAAASYRLELIKQKKVEAELLVILKWQHEESLKTGEEYSQRERTYNQTIEDYKKRIAELENREVPDGEGFESVSGESEKDMIIRLLLLKNDLLAVQNNIFERLNSGEIWK
jgi:tetratricopeptide (TPR) repeat protein